MKRRIKNVAVLGSGIMGSRIACHFANIGLNVILLDISPSELNEKEQKLGLRISDSEVKNRIVNEALDTAVKSSPSPLYSKHLKNHITVGNFDEDFEKISTADWILEAVIERLDIKNSIFAKVDNMRKKGSIVSTNTSGIPIHSMIEGRSEDFKQYFLGTHFFNPPRYLELLEIIPTSNTKKELVEYLMDYGQRFLGKKTVLCKDTPAFIANRIGVYSIMSLFHTVKELKLDIETVDQLTGPVLGRPKSATFRTCDVVGLDTLVKVAQGVYDNCPDDEQREIFKIPEFINTMVENKWLGSKSKKGFYEKRKDANGKSEIWSLDLENLTYRAKKKVRLASIGEAKKEKTLKAQIKTLINHQDEGGQFLRKVFYQLFSYVSFRIPEISEDISRIDDAMRAGFGWSFGPFETWDILGLNAVVEQMKKEKIPLASWIDEMMESGVDSFYEIKNGEVQVYNYERKSLEPSYRSSSSINMRALKHTNTIWNNKDSTIIDLGDGILQLEFHSKMNSIGAGVIQGINKAIDLAEKEYEGLVIYNEGQNFSVGADVGMIFMMAVEQEYDELAYAVKTFQQTVMRLRYSSIPVIVAPHQMTLGGGCEIAMHADKVIAHAETYIGLVEFGVGVIPGGGGTKEFALRLSDELKEGDIRTNAFRERFLTIGQAKVATSALEAFELGYLRSGIDEYCVGREQQLSRAKQSALQLANNGYTPPSIRKDITVLGNEAVGLVYAGANSMMAGNYISEHDQFISEKLGYVLAGGELTEVSKVSEQYLLDMERKAFVELCMKRKTLERLQSMITKGKVLRN